MSTENTKDIKEDQTKRGPESIIKPQGEGTSIKTPEPTENKKEG